MFRYISHRKSKLEAIFVSKLLKKNNEYAIMYKVNFTRLPVVDIIDVIILSFREKAYCRFKVKLVFCRLGVICVDLPIEKIIRGYL